MIHRTQSKEVDDPDGYTPIQCFVLIDSHGERNGPYPCTDHNTLNRVLNGKKGVNLQIAMWVEGVMDGTTFPKEVKDWTKDYPEWVFESFIRKLCKVYFQKHGWIPTFIRMHS